MTDINSNTPMDELTIGGNIYTAGNAKEFKTGDWRSTTPVFIEEKCKQCGLCFPVCPDDAIPVNKECKREDFDFALLLPSQQPSTHENHRLVLVALQSFLLAESKLLRSALPNASRRSPRELHWWK